MFMIYIRYCKYRQLADDRQRLLFSSISRMKQMIFPLSNKRYKSSQICNYNQENWFFKPFFSRAARHESTNDDVIMNSHTSVPKMVSDTRCRQVSLCGGKWVKGASTLNGPRTKHLK